MPVEPVMNYFTQRTESNRFLPLEILPPSAQIACEKLKEALQKLLGSDLLALWAYGAQTFADFPKRLGDIDTHAVLSHEPDIKTAAAIDQIHARIAADLGVEWDSWYILRKDAVRAQPPKHAFREDLTDDAWALHRAHWLAGQYVLLAGSPPRKISWRIRAGRRYKTIFGRSGEASSG